MFACFHNKIKSKMHLHNNRAVTCDFQHFGILTSVDSDEHVQPAFKLM